MQDKIKNKIEKELAAFIRHFDKTYALSRLCPLLFNSIKNFVLRKGKRLRPFLFVVGYLGFAKGAAPGLYKTAISFELLHDFLLVHDDIIDKAAIRRGKPSMHKMLNSSLERFKALKFNGQDLAIIAGDIMYAMAIEAFLSIKENTQRKEKALRKFITAATYTGIGEFIELLAGAKDIERLTKEDIYRIYDYKTACYTFAYPLSCGAILAGAGQKEIERLYQYGMYLGRAFQIKDDILDMFSEESESGKSALTDLQEAKKTLLLWLAYKNSGRAHRLDIKRTLAKPKLNKKDLLKMRRLISASGALKEAMKEALLLLKKAQGTINSCRMRARYKALLKSYSTKLLQMSL